MVKIFTVGTHAYDHKIQLFINDMAKHGITVLVDVRSVPYSSWQTIFNRENLRRKLQDVGLTYVWKGKCLGGKTWPDKPEGYSEGLEWLKKKAETETVCIMCMEPDPEKCHREMWIGEDLRKMGVEVEHIIRNPKAKKNPNHRLTKFFR